MITLAIAAMLSIPAVSASWSAYGGFEPDNNLDSRSFMWDDAPAAATNRIYFNGFVVEGTLLVGVAMFNPNVAALETQNEPIGDEGYVAILGNWADCNGDGYVGMAETGVREYDAALLTSTAICPARTGSPGATGANCAVTPTAWSCSGRPHNWNGWVTELIPIGGHGNAGLSTGSNGDDDNSDLRVIRDYEARIWGDRARPTDPGPAGGNSACPIEPFPKGTWQSTGGALNYADCFVGVNGRWNSLWADSLTVNPAGTGNQTVPLLGDPLGLRFADPDDARSGTLGQQQTFGDEEESHAAVSAFDCNAAPLFHAGDLLNSSGADAAVRGATGNGINGSVHDITIWAPGPAVNANDPTIPGQFNRTNEETDFDGSGCDTSNDGGRDFYGGILDESDSFNAGGSESVGKTASDFNLRFEDAGRIMDHSRGSFPLSLLHPGQSGASRNILPLEFEWSANSILVGGTPDLVQTRGTVAGGDIAFDGFAAARYVTFYAYVGALTTSKGYLLPGSPSGVEYGAAQCGALTSGKQANWACDPALWNRNADGTPEDGVEGGNGVVHMLYNLRDVDCLDGSNLAGVATQPAGHGTQACVNFGQ